MEKIEKILKEKTNQEILDYIHSLKLSALPENHPTRLLLEEGFVDSEASLSMKLLCLSSYLCTELAERFKSKENVEEDFPDLNSFTKYLERSLSEHFIKFMKEEGAWYAYCLNTYEDKENHKIDGAIFYKEQNYILGAFFWWDTLQEADYWNDLNKKWLSSFK